MKTTDKEWEEYHSDLAAFECRMDMVKPKREEYEEEKDFDKAMCEWQMSMFCDGPVKPGQEYANNH